ncbi:MAG TPA: hypothetical protein VKV27_03155 [Solirubrobacteraceae bacterium]|nr:hypothetical protein [Solirubrobacteraceae bacterium]
MFPLALLLAHAAAAHARFTGADGLIGADGVLGADQLQYLAWIRDAAAHGGLASDLFTLSPSGHVYLEPLFAISAALYRLGAGLQVAYLVWKPVAALALAAAAIAWARRAFGERPAARAAAVALSLFLCTPVAALLSWTQLAGGRFRFNLYLLGDELLLADKPWGYAPSAIGVALAAASLLCVARALEGERGGHSHRPAARSPLALGALAALLASWLHPWQGITLVIVLCALAAARRLRGAASLALPAACAALPLLYYLALSHSDPAWRAASHYEVIPRLPALALLAGLGPLAALAALGVRRPRGQAFELIVLLWPLASLLTYFANDAFAPHAFQGLSLPLSVLMVRGWRRLRAGPLLGTIAICLATVPGLAFDARKFVRTARGHAAQYYLPRSDAAALDWVAAHAPPGGVLAPTPFAAVVPSQTGRAVWVGHGYWSDDYPLRAREVDRLFGGRMTATQARRFVQTTGASILISDCSHPRDLRRALGPLIARTRSFGCARVYLLRSSMLRSSSASTAGP